MLEGHLGWNVHGLGIGQNQCVGQLLPIHKQNVLHASVGIVGNLVICNELAQYLIVLSERFEPIHFEGIVIDGRGGKDDGAGVDHTARHLQDTIVVVFDDVAEFASLGHPMQQYAGRSK